MSSKATFAGPPDRSVESYKVWVAEIVAALGGEIEDDITEQEWADECAAFWRRADAGAEDVVSLAAEPDPAELRRRLDSILDDD